MKTYVAVEALFDTEGGMHPKCVIWEDGRRFEITQVSDVRRAASLKAGGTGLRVRCRIGRRETYLYFEDPRWFVDSEG
ncbi:MAG: hypothetical protein Q4C13_07580 [Clostridia bacterium]|nr:hypothetical protein [Clostridia bacterium]